MTNKRLSCFIQFPTVVLNRSLLSSFVEISRIKMFQYGGSHNVGFLKFYILTIRTVKKDKLRHCAKFCQNRSNHTGDMSFFIFQDGGRRYFGVLKLKIFHGGTVTRVELHHCAKFRQNRSNRDRDMAIFRFFIMAAAAMLYF